MKDRPELLDLMLRDEAQQSAIYRPGPYWIGNQQRALAAIERDGITRFRGNPAIGKGYADIVLVDPSDAWVIASWKDRLKQRLIRLPIFRDLFAQYVAIARTHQQRGLNFMRYYYLHEFGDWLPKAIERMPDTLVGGCELEIEVGGQMVAPFYLDMMMTIDNYASRVDFTKVRTIMEIGGGFGANIHLLLTLYPNIRKVFYLDIPPMIYIGTEYLRHFFGDAVKDYASTRELEKVSFTADDSLEIVCLCPWQIERANAELDMFWNAASLPEMTPDIVRNYGSNVMRMLRDGADVCLRMNKANESRLTTMPSAVQSAFSDVTFEQFQPLVEHAQYMAYTHGKRTLRVSAPPPHVL